MNASTEKLLITSVLLGCLFFTIPVQAMLNPSAVYCEKMGYSYETLNEPQGEYGVCHLPNNQTVHAWYFLRGTAGREYTYCARMGYPSKTITDPKVCRAVRDNACLVCVLPDKSEVEVTTLMNLSFAETLCGDGRCATTENALNCPQDCPQSGADELCQSKFDFKCDQDCYKDKGDIDCVYLDQPGNIIILVVAVILILVALVYWIRKKKPVK